MFTAVLEYDTNKNSSISKENISFLWNKKDEEWCSSPISFYL